MCIALVSTLDDEYLLVLLSNRDEYFVRETATAHFWPPNKTILAGQDQERVERGTWLGISKEGKLGVLTNFREPVKQENPSDNIKSDSSSGGVKSDSSNSDIKNDNGSKNSVEGSVTLKNNVDGSVTPKNNFDGSKILNNSFIGSVTPKNSVEGSVTPNLVKGVFSRGCLVRSYLESDCHSEQEWAKTLHNVEQYGGFSLLIGKLQPEKLLDLFLISNRTDDVVRLSPMRTIGLSNNRFTDQEWPKVTRGKKLLDDYLSSDERHSDDKEKFIEKLFAILSTEPDESQKKEIAKLNLSTSIFIPVFEAPPFPPYNDVDGHKRIYGTRQQTIILVDRSLNVTYVERTRHLQEDNAISISEKTFTFQIE